MERNGMRRILTILSAEPELARQIGEAVKQRVGDDAVIDHANFANLPDLEFQDCHLLMMVAPGNTPALSKATAEIHGRCPEVPMVVLTERLPEDQAKALHRNGVLKIISLPATLDEIASPVAEIFESVCRGFISGVSLAVALQMLELERKTCTLTVSKEDRRGVLFFREGELIQAMLDGRSGEEAAMEIASWDDVKIEFREFCAPIPRGVEMPLAFILLESSRRKDEASGRASDEDQEQAGSTEPLAEGAGESGEEGLLDGLDDLDFDVAPATPAFDLDQAMAEGPLAKPLKAIQVALAKAIGPIAPTIFKQHAEQWAKDNEPVEENLDQLIDLLCVEIDDDELIEEFRAALGL